MPVGKFLCKRILIANSGAEISIHHTRITIQRPPNRIPTTSQPPLNHQTTTTQPQPNHHRLSSSDWFFQEPNEFFFYTRQIFVCLVFLLTFLVVFPQILSFFLFFGNLSKIDQLKIAVYWNTKLWFWLKVYRAIFRTHPTICFDLKTFAQLGKNGTLNSIWPTFICDVFFEFFRIFFLGYVDIKYIWNPTLFD